MKTMNRLLILSLLMASAVTAMDIRRDNAELEPITRVISTQNMSALEPMPAMTPIIGTPRIDEQNFKPLTLLHPRTSVGLERREFPINDFPELLELPKSRRPSSKKKQNLEGFEEMFGGRPSNVSTPSSMSTMSGAYSRGSDDSEKKWEEYIAELRQRWVFSNEMLTRYDADIAESQQELVDINAAVVHHNWELERAYNKKESDMLPILRKLKQVKGARSNFIIQYYRDPRHYHSLVRTPAEEAQSLLTRLDTYDDQLIELITSIEFKSTTVIQEQRTALEELKKRIEFYNESKRRAWRAREEEQRRNNYYSNRILHAQAQSRIEKKQKESRSSRSSVNVSPVPHRTPSSPISPVGKLYMDALNLELENQK